MYLSDIDILEAIRRSEIRIQPFHDLLDLQAASVDLHLGAHFQNFIGQRMPLTEQILDVAKPVYDQFREEFATNRIVLRPGEFILAETIEQVTLSSSIVGRLEGKSSLGRLGLLVHVTAGFVDPGWNGVLTLEIVNLLPVAVAIYPGMPIAQISFSRTQTPSGIPYAGKYRGAIGPQVSQFYKNFKDAHEKSA